MWQDYVQWFGGGKEGSWASLTQKKKKKTWKGKHMEGQKNMRLTVGT